jgi:hypothetical protein
MHIQNISASSVWAWVCFRSDRAVLQIQVLHTPMFVYNLLKLCTSLLIIYHVYKSHVSFLIYEFIFFPLLFFKVLGTVHGVKYVM